MADGHPYQDMPTLEEGMRMSVVLGDGQIMTGTITHVEESVTEDGMQTVQYTMQQFPDVPTTYLPLED